jgi:uncharacterized protein (DUF885 family)
LALQTPTVNEAEGRYRYNGSNLRERSLLNAGALISHELVPGHHFQINLQRENTTLPKFRRESGYTAFTEGWGDYASDLAGPMGMYADPYDWCGRAMDLSDGRLVGLGMNAFDWRARAIAYEGNTFSPMPRSTPSAALFRRPAGQALAYKMGMRKLVALREGEEVSRREIRHPGTTTPSSAAALPLDVFERHIGSSPRKPLSPAGGENEG